MYLVKSLDCSSLSHSSCNCYRWDIMTVRSRSYDCKSNNASRLMQIYANDFNSKSLVAFQVEYLVYMHICIWFPDTNSVRFVIFGYPYIQFETNAVYALTIMPGWGLYITNYADPCRQERAREMFCDLKEQG